MKRKLIIIAALSILGLVSCAKHRTIDRNTLLRQEMFDPCEIVYTGTVVVNREQKIYMDVPDTSLFGIRITLFIDENEDKFMKEYDRMIYTDNEPLLFIPLRVYGNHLEKMDKTLRPIYYRYPFIVRSYTFIEEENR